jgi:hypothetical protein
VRAARCAGPTATRAAYVRCAQAGPPRPRAARARARARALAPPLLRPAGLALTTEPSSGSARSRGAGSATGTGIGGASLPIVYEPGEVAGGLDACARALEHP